MIKMGAYFYFCFVFLVTHFSYSLQMCSPQWAGRCTNWSLAQDGWRSMGCFMPWRRRRVPLATLTSLLSIGPGKVQAWGAEGRRCGKQVEGWSVVAPSEGSHPPQQHLWKQFSTLSSDVGLD